MRFHLSDEQEMLQDSIRRSAVRLVDPATRRAMLDGETDFDQKVWDGMMELGLGALLVSEEDGGAGLGLEDAALAVETLGETATPGPFIGHILAGLAISLGSDASVKEAWLEKLVTGEAVGTIALSGDGQPGSWTPTLSGDKLTGEVRFVMGGDRASVFVVGAADGSLVAVENGPGVTITPVSSSDMTRRLWSVSFKDAPAKVIAGSNISAKVVDAALVFLAADALGGAEQCLSMAVEYAKTREQFGVLIGQFQGLKHQLANMALEVEPARALMWYAAYAFDAGLPDASRAAAHAKAHLADRFTSVARMAVQAHGGIGYTWEYDLQIYFRRALFDRAYLGSPSLHRERVAEMAGW